MSVNHFKAFLGGSKGNDFLILGVTDHIKPFLAKFFHLDTPEPFFHGRLKIVRDESAPPIGLRSLNKILQILAILRANLILE